ncbi:hypothetical protein GCM10027445_64180 [Amycolatopsis endophytica]|uniref:Squalene cyclase n=1 Tax=Amycolatopsis endophytica TaxID=860233 RepID=A0A853B1E9_9PSEU|nr:prenyltransferase/squalene oxidase repeat-containing protein [Amycolatopsis endophytica]NYI88702.1 squalene cyclase [Amycolatopsis endophytica]
MTALRTLAEKRGRDLGQVVTGALDYLTGCRRPDGSIAEDPAIRIFQDWDSVNALKAIGLWPEFATGTHRRTAEAIMDFLRAREKPTGMLSWGVLATGPADYCTETSSEYVTALTLAGRGAECGAKASFLRARQLPSGPWAEVHPHIPQAFQTEPSVTGFAAMALTGLDQEPRYLDEMLAFLAGRQQPDGHFGINWYYYGTYYYLMAPAVAALAEFGHLTAVARARDFVLSQQRQDGSWFDQIDEFGDYSSPEQHTAMALETLAHAGVGVGEPAVARGVDWLLGRVRPDGGWRGGRYPYPDTDSYRGFHATQDVFTTARAMSALKLLDGLEA